jgi:ABC-2 type transport system ATP-binding protein
LAVEGLTKRFGRRTAVEDVAAVVGAGEICGLVGANGSGKTTTLRMLAGIVRPDGGCGRVIGFDLLRDAAKIREQVGYMSQRLSLYADLSVFENLRFRAAVYSLRDPRATVEATIAEFGLARWARQPAGSLSGGWARQLQLAAALLHSPRLVLLDEPTAGLDTIARQEVWRRIERLAAAGAGIILCTHDLADAERCSHVAYFESGRILAAGTPAEIAANTPIAVFLLAGDDIHRLSARVARTAGVIMSYPQNGRLRVIADPLAAGELSRLAATHGASIAAIGMKFEDAVLAASMAADR